MNDKGRIERLYSLVELNRSRLSRFAIARGGGGDNGSYDPEAF